MEHLKCPRIESSWSLCDDEASYCIDGVVYCRRHAWFIMENTRQPEWGELRKNGSVRKES